MNKLFKFTLYIIITILIFIISIYYWLDCIETKQNLPKKNVEVLTKFEKMKNLSEEEFKKQKSYVGNFMDYVLTTRLAETVVIAQKECLTSRLINSNHENKQPEILLYYRGLCNLFLNELISAKNDFQKANNINQHNKYQVFTELVSIIIEGYNYERIIELLNNNPKYSEEIFCRLKGPEILKRYIKPLFTTRHPDSLQQAYLKYILTGKNFLSKIKTEYLFKKKKYSYNLYLYDPYTLFYLSTLNQEYSNKNYKANMPDNKSTYKNDLQYLYTKYCIKQKKIPETLVNLFQQKYKDSNVLLTIFNTWILLTDEKVDYNKLFSCAAQFIYKNQLNMDVVGNSIVLQFYIDFAIASYHVDDFNHAYKWILTLPAIQNRYPFLEVSNYYMSWSLYNK